MRGTLIVRYVVGQTPVTAAWLPIKRVCSEAERKSLEWFRRRTLEDCGGCGGRCNKRKKARSEGNTTKKDTKNNKEKRHKLRQQGILKKEIRVGGKVSGLSYD